MPTATPSPRPPMGGYPARTMLAALLGCTTPALDSDPTTATETARSDSAVDTDTGFCWPSAELCDGEDNDCDGAIDEEARDRSTFYTDADGDGFGTGEGEQGCEAPEGTSAADGDCDDGRADVSPDASERLDGVDNDCDGTLDVLDAEDAAWVLTGAAPGDGAGRMLRPTSDGAGLLVGVPLAEEGLGAAYWLTAAETGSLAVLGVDVLGDGGSFGAAVATGPDGLWLVGAPDADDGAEDGGAVSVFTALPTGDDDSPTVRWAFDEATAHAGWSLAVSTGSTGEPSVAIGVPYAEIDEESEGAVLWMDGPVEGSSLDERSARLDGDERYQLLGFALDRCDLTGDGLADTLVGAPSSAINPESAGGVAVVDGTSTGTLTLEDVAWLPGEQPQDFAGVAVSCPGDVDGDGYGEAWVGAPGSDLSYNAGGAAYLVQGPITSDRTLADSWGVVVGDGAVDYLGQDVGSAGDLDDDGLAELLVGAFYADDGGDASGTAYVYYGLTSGTTMATESGTRLVGAEAFDVLGVGLTGTDLDGDGDPEIWIGGALSDEGGLDAGAIFGWEYGQTY